MAVDRDLQARFRFFQENAGGIVGERARGALQLARTEILLERATDLEAASVAWEYDPEPYDVGDVCTEEEARAKFDSNEWTGPFGCVVRVGDDVTASLWGIVLGSRETGDPYARVVAAELALESEDELRQAIGDAADERAGAGVVV